MLAPPEFLQPALSRPVAILGGGVSGEGVRQLLAALGAEGKIYDASPAKGADFAAADARRNAPALVVFSPGFPPDHPWLARARAAGALCLGELDFASVFWRGHVVAITGTNGKTTLTEFLAHALNEKFRTEGENKSGLVVGLPLAGRPPRLTHGAGGGPATSAGPTSEISARVVTGREAYAVGNIGRPFSQLVAETRGGAHDMFALCEVSSFQAEAFTHFRADATLWTNFAEDHLERHRSLESYFAAKWKLVAHTKPNPSASLPAAPASPAAAPTVFVGSSVQRYAQKFQRPLGDIVPVATEDSASAPTSASASSDAAPHAPAALAGAVFAAQPQRENFLLAAAWWRAHGFDEAALYSAARTFKLGRHRLARVAEHEGVAFWNDSKATNFHAVEAALAGFRAPVVLIAGGRSKGGDLAGFVHRIAPRVKHLALIGETSADLAFHCAAFRVAHTSCASLPEAVRRAAEIAEPGEHVLLSPGFASFDMFRSYEDRGEQFENLVRTLPVPIANSR